MIIKNFFSYRFIGILTAVISIFTLIFTFSTCKDKQNDEFYDLDVAFKEALSEILHRKNSGDKVYDINLLPLLQEKNARFHDAEYFNYIKSRFNIVNGPVVEEQDTHRKMYLKSGMIEGWNLKCYGWSYSINERIIFGFTYLDPEYKILYKTSLYLVYTGLI